MKRPEMTPTFFLSLVGAVLILANGLWIVVNGGPIVLSSYPVVSLTDVRENAFWVRISFGIKGLTEGMAALIWLVFGVGMLVSAIRIGTNPRSQKKLGLPIMAFSILTIPIGGGFILGSILGFVGGALGSEWPKPFGTTFLGRMIRAARLDSKLYRTIVEDPGSMRTAAIMIMLINLLSGLGNSLYTYNLSKIKTGTASEVSTILLDGIILWSNFSILTALGFIGIALVKWLVLTLAIYIVGVKIMGSSSSFDMIARSSAFAYVPVLLQVFMPVVFSKYDPFLSSTWPMSIFFLTNLWMIVSLVVAVRETLDVTTTKALGVVILGGTMYWLANNIFIIPTLELPGIRLELALPQSLAVLLVLVTLAAVIAIFLGVFTRRKA